MYEDLILELEEAFHGSFIGEYDEDMEEAFKEVLPDNSSIVSEISGYDENGLMGSTSISIVQVDDDYIDVDDKVDIEMIEHEHYLITWELTWERFFKHLQFLCEGEVVSW